jgi:lipopolysaccharide export system permease protein
MLLFRSTFFQLILPFLMALGILTFILSMETVYRLIHLIVERGVSVFSVGMMLLYRLPQFLSVTLPLAIVIACVVLMVRLSTDRTAIFFIWIYNNRNCFIHNPLAAACWICGF